ncbi:hypothetical protein KP509_23G052200 [Ceratopteris richardii]|uniref:Sodium/calcium exchanger membrane region domain-containing protein n=1 Tax=Ceratopteris richardii TaxID=49495 RepID=A0A8T2S2X7_CERRI|nr:hypothetical protein KP509_23G052200 [Ceratopteris richardii]
MDQQCSLSAIKFEYRRFCDVEAPLCIRYGITPLLRPPVLLFIFLVLPTFLPSSTAESDSLNVGSGIGKHTDSEKCEILIMKKTLINYGALYACVFHHSLGLSVIFLLVLVAFAFYILATAAQSYFSPVVARMADMLHLSPSTGGVTLLALGNGAPDVFASIAAVWGGNPRIGLGATVSAGLFVTGLVVGFVALAASPFDLKPTTFLRDICFYILAVTLMFLLYMSGEVYAWQAYGLVFLYIFFVAVVFFMDHHGNRDRSSKEYASDFSGYKIEDHGKQNAIQLGKHTAFNVCDQTGANCSFENYDDNNKFPDVENGSSQGSKYISQGGKTLKGGRSLFSVFEALICSIIPCKDFDSIKCNAKLQLLWHLPVEIVLRSTIPAVDPSRWNRVYASLNLVCCPLIILYIISAAISPFQQFVFIIPGINWPLWLLVLIQGSALGLAYYVFTKKPPENELPIAVVTAFIMSVFWISFIAGELLGCLATLGKLLKLPPALLGLTVLAWGNSIGDLVADVAVARAGQPAMAMAGCFAGPMFNMLVGFGLALALKASRMHPNPYELEYNPSIVIAFGFLFISLLGSLMVITWSRFQVPRCWGLCLISLYITFVVVSISSLTTL